MSSRRTFIGALLLAGLLPAVAGAASGTILDRRTGATLQLSTEPWVLALDQPHLAAHARDYIALYAVEINIAGKRGYHLAAFLWSTVPGRGQYAGDKPVLQLRAGDRELKLDPLGRTPRDMGISQWPLKPPGHGAVLAIYEVDEALLRAMSTDIKLQVRPASDATLPEDVWFDVWRSGRRAFAEFSARTLE
ncbi:MAG: hypothetical protein U1F39_10005 [Steroidobacteraceae bacterium]